MSGLQQRPKICVNCRHCAKPGAVVKEHLCTYEAQNGPIDLVTGLPTIDAVICRHERSEKGKCGPDGVLWEPIHISPPKPLPRDWRSGSTGGY